ncbi:MAG: DUF2795 domain-containing protein [Candidatus Aquicultor sp.]
MIYSSIASALEGVDFPVDKRSLISQAGNRNVNVFGHTMVLQDLLNACSHDSFDSIQDIVLCPEIVDIVNREKAA